MFLVPGYSSGQYEKQESSIHLKNNQCLWKNWAISRLMCFFWHSVVYLLVPAWVCNVSAGTDPPKCSVSLSHTDFLWTKLTIMLHFHFHPNVFKVYVLIICLWEKWHAELVICLIVSTWKSWAIFSYSPIWSPSAPVRCVHCLALVLVARTGCQDVSREVGVGGWGWGAVSQPGGASCLCVVWCSGGGVLYCQPKLVFAEKRCQLTCFVYLWFPRLHVPPFRSC